MNTDRKRRQSLEEFFHLLGFLRTVANESSNNLPIKLNILWELIYMQLSVEDHNFELQELSKMGWKALGLSINDRVSDIQRSINDVLNEIGDDQINEELAVYFTSKVGSGNRFSWYDKYDWELDRFHDSNLGVRSNIYESFSTFTKVFRVFWLESYQEKQWDHFFEKKVEFPNHLKQAGLSILSYFNEIIQIQHPNENLKVAIVQSSSNTIQMLVSAPNYRLIESVKNTLQEYALYISGKKENFTRNNPEIIANLNHKLQIASNEITHKQETIEQQKTIIVDKQNEIEEQRKILGQLILNQSSLNQALNTLIEKQGNEMGQLLLNLEKLIEKDVDEAFKDDIIECLSTIRQKDSNVFKQIGDLAKGTLTGTSGRYLYELIEIVRNSIIP